MTWPQTLRPPREVLTDSALKETRPGAPLPPAYQEAATRFVRTKDDVWGDVIPYSPRSRKLGPVFTGIVRTMAAAYVMQHGEKVPKGTKYLTLLSRDEGPYHARHPEQYSQADLETWSKMGIVHAHKTLRSAKQFLRQALKFHHIYNRHWDEASKTWSGESGPLAPHGKPWPQDRPDRRKGASPKQQRDWDSEWMKLSAAERKRRMATMGPEPGQLGLEISTDDERQAEGAARAGDSAELVGDDLPRDFGKIPKVEWSVSIPYSQTRAIIILSLRLTASQLEPARAATSRWAGRGTHGLIGPKELGSRTQALAVCVCSTRESADDSAREWLEAYAGKSSGAAEAFAETHGGEAPTEVHEVTVDAPSSDLVELGELRRIVYRTSKGKRVHDYEHTFGETGGDAPRLGFDEALRLFIVGGSYTVTTSGIEG